MYIHLYMHTVTYVYLSTHAHFNFAMLIIVQLVDFDCCLNVFWELGALTAFASFTHAQIGLFTTDTCKNQCANKQENLALLNTIFSTHLCKYIHMYLCTNTFILNNDVAIRPMNYERSIRPNQQMWWGLCFSILCLSFDRSFHLSLFSIFTFGPLALWTQLLFDMHSSTVVLLMYICICV